MKGSWWWWDDAVAAARSFASMSHRKHKVEMDRSTGLWAVSEASA